MQNNITTIKNFIFDDKIKDTLLSVIVIPKSASKWATRYLGVLTPSLESPPPTSSGKTVLSTYVTSCDGKVLFVVPTEPLAMQVAAAFSKDQILDDL